MDVQQAIAVLDGFVAELGAQRSSDALASDLYEAADDWRNLGYLLLEGSERTDFQGRARQEVALMTELRAAVREQSADAFARYAPLFAAGEALIQAALLRRPPEGGVFGIVRVARTAFAFLLGRGFVLAVSTPTRVRLASRHLVVELAVDNDPSAAFVFGPADGDARFSLADLLFMHGDPRLSSLPTSLRLDSEAAVARWFTLAADLFRECGEDVIANAPGVFERLERAQTERDAAYVREINARCSGQAGLS
jgi:hypothetical protein